VELTDFSGFQRNLDNVLQWHTASEYNSDHFELERSEDGLRFFRIANVRAANLSYNTLSYQFVDKNIKSHTYYYRLRSVDINNDYRLSNIVVLRSKGLPQKMFVLNNPLQGNQLAVRFFESPGNIVQLELFDAWGRSVAREQFVAGSRIINWALPNLANGVYILRAGIGKNQFTAKVVK
jgi:hypothetical protein